jgi:aryl-alcohol dehydrogenase-like predicted oxidoreductase
MKYNKLGKSDLLVSEICFGCMSLDLKEDSNKRIIDKAIDLGLNFFDTADFYDKGENERLIGKTIRQKRKNIVLATKVGNQWNPDGKTWSWNASRKYIMGAVEDSLKRLQTDYIDLYQLHGGTMEDNIPETISAFEDLKQQGKIRYYGISSIRPVVIREYLRQASLSTVMMQYSLLDRRPEEEVMALLEKNTISVLARGVLAKGMLAGKSADKFLNYSPAEVARAARAIQEISIEGRTSAQSAIRFALRNKTVASAVVGIRTMEQCEEVLAATNARVLTGEETGRLSDILPPNLYTEHR